MAGFEVIVRPVVFPNIRPPAARALAPGDDPEQGFAVLSGSGGQVIDLPLNVSQSMSKSKPAEIERRVDEARVYQMEDDGTVNRDNFVDIDVANKITFDEGDDLPTGVRQEISPKHEMRRDWFFARVKEAENIEIMKENQIKKNDDYKGDAQ